MGLINYICERHEIELPTLFALCEPASTIAQPSRGGRSVQSHDQTIYASSAALSSEQAPSSQLLGSAGRLSQDSGYSDGRRKDFIVDNSLQNVVHLPPSAKAHMTHIEPVSPARALQNGRVLETRATDATFNHSKESTRTEPMDTAPVSPRHARMSSGIPFQWGAWVQLPSEYHGH